MGYWPTYRKDELKRLPREASQFVGKFDDGVKVEPFEFEIP